MVDWPRIHEIAILTPAPLAGLVVRRDRTHAPVAAYLAWLAATDVVRQKVIQEFRPSWSHPLEGLSRAIYHLDGALVLSWQFLFAAVSLHYFVGRGARVVIGAWLAACALLVAAYPGLSGPALQRVHLWVLYASPAVSWTIILCGLLRRRDLRPRLAHLVLITFAATDVVSSAFPLVSGDFHPWPVVSFVGLCASLTIDAAHVAWLTRRRAPATAA